MDKINGLQKVDEAEMTRVEGGSSDWPDHGPIRPPRPPGLPRDPVRIPGAPELPCPDPFPRGPFDDVM